MEKRKVGRPAGKNFVVLAISVTKSEMENIEKAHEKFEQKNSVKISKSQFVRKHLADLIK